MHRILLAAWHIVATVIVATALLGTALRLALPQLGAQRPMIEARVSERVGHAVTIGALTANWRGARPSLTANDIRIIGGDGVTPIMRFDHARGEIALLKSLTARELVMQSITLRGLQLTLLRGADGRITVAGFPAGDTRFREWLLDQPDFSVENADVAFIDRLRDAPSQVLRGVTIHITQGTRGPRLRGHVEHAGSFDAPIDFELVLEKPDESDRRTTDLTLAIPGLDVAETARYLGALPWTGPAGRADVALRLRWRDAQLTRVGFDAASDTLRWTDGRGGTLGRVHAAGVATVGAGRDWHLAFTALELATSGDTASALDVRADVAMREDGRIVRATASHLPVAALQLLGRLLPAEATTVREFLRDAAPVGDLRDVRIGWRSDARTGTALYLAGRLRHAGLRAVGRLPGVVGLDAQLVLNRHGGAVGFRRASFTVTAEHLAKALAVTGLRGRTTWRNDDGGWRVASTGLTAVVNDFPLRLAGHANVTPGERPTVDLELEVGAGDVTQFHYFMPSGIMSPKGDQWLRNAFRQGRLDAANLSLRGPLATFPFDDGQGIFTADFIVSGVELDYSDKWPYAHDVDGRIVMAGRKLAGLITAGRFYDSPIETVSLGMEDMFTHQPVLTVAGVADATFEDALHVIRESPLAAGPANRLADLDVDGTLGLTLDLNLGLRAGARRTVLGKVELRGNRLHSARNGITLEDLRGTLSFTREDWYGEDITAVYDGQRVGLVVSGGVGDPNYDSEFRMTGTADASRLASYLQRYVPFVHGWLERAGQLGALAGTLPWKAVLTVPRATDPGTPVARRLVIESSFKGLAVDLPWPLGKTAGQSLPVRIETTLGDPGARTTRVGYGEALTVQVAQAAALDGKRPLHGVDVALGAGTASEPVGEAIKLHGTVPRLSLTEWASLVKGAPPAGAGGRPLPIGFEFGVQDLHVLGQDFVDLAVRGHRDAVAWRIRLDGARAAGEVTVPHDMDAFPLTLNLDRLWLTPAVSQGDDGKQRPDPRRIPPVVLACNSFKYGTIDLGQVALASERVADGQRLSTIVFNTPAFQINATGSWLVGDNEHRSQFDIDLAGGELAGVLTTFGYDASAIEGGRTELEIQAEWLGTPADFTLDRLDGRLRLKVEKGRFLDIEPGGGRLFGLLSLQTLPRRLSLDFADLFQKGFAFDSIEGWFELEKGNAYTNSLVMEGPSARLEVSGRTGLAAHDYDQRAVVTPALSSSIPLASALFGPAGIGVGAAIYLGQKVFKGIPEQVDRLLRRQYSITGPWQDPVIEKL